jgi:1,4-dihydroxy-2-naphthoate octaprenyltransferase
MMNGEMTVEVDAGRKPKWLLYLMELRAPFFISSHMPVLFGTALACSRTGEWNWPMYLLAGIGLMLVNAATNVTNDYFDHLSGNDAANVDFVRPFTGGSRMIQRGLLLPGEILGMAIVCTVLALVIGFYLFLKAGWVVLLLGIIGLGGGLLYTAPGIGMGAHGLGELTVAMNVGVLPVVGAYYVQARTFSWDVVLLSLPLSLLITAILFINQFQDYRADMAVGKRNWVVRLGRKKSLPVYWLLMTVWALPVVAGVVLGYCSNWCLLVLVAMIPALAAMIVASKYYDDMKKLTPANGLTIATHLVVGVLLSVVLVLTAP